MEKTVYITEEEREKCRQSDWCVCGTVRNGGRRYFSWLMLVGTALLNCSAIHRHMALRSLTPIQTATAYLRGFGRNGLV